MPTFVITSATGHQGGATARALLSSGAQVHALVRDPTTASARRLESQGAKLFPYRDFTDYGAIGSAAQGCRGVFLTLWPTPDAPEQTRSIGKLQFLVIDIFLFLLFMAGWLGFGA